MPEILYGYEVSMHFLDIATVHSIIELAKVCYPMKDEPQEVSVSDVFDSLENPNERVLYQQISSLSPDQLAELHALMLIGRNSSGEALEDWNTLCRRVVSPEYIASKRQLAEYLNHGLTRLGH